MKRTLVAVGALALLMVGGCSGSTPDPQSADPAESSAPATIEVELTMDVVVNDDGSVSLSAKSNLPDGTELGGSVFAEGSFTAQDPGVLRGGRVDFGPFSDKGNPLSAGTYDVSVTMPIARNQPDEVKAIIGEHGENLTGPQVSKESITGDAVVEISEPLVIP
jgi:hypothetical protein